MSKLIINMINNLDYFFNVMNKIKIYVIIRLLLKCIYIFRIGNIGKTMIIFKMNMNKNNFDSKILILMNYWSIIVFHKYLYMNIISIKLMDFIH